MSRLTGFASALMMVSTLMVHNIYLNRLVLLYIEIFDM